MKIKDFLAHNKKIIDSALEELLPVKAEPELITEAMRYSIFAGGKRLRPILVLSTYRATGGKKIDQILPAACAVEMIHTYSLIHDDLPAMDNDDFRRGKPSCHKQFGEAIAILAGDALFAKSFEVLQKTKVSAEIILRVNKMLSSTVGVDGIIGGQVMDITSSSDKKDRKLLKYIHTHKTGKFISGCMVIGATLANAYKNEIAALKRAGDMLGLAFQIVDDILDIKSTKKTLGKSVHKDTDKKKLTYPVVYGLEESIKKSTQLLEKTIAVFNEELRFRDTTELENIAEFIVNRIY
ncbi:MAG: polyprenyl synthetase family protein [Candidatus Cloacimonadota bacterium]|nr:MAG: polyprenyl synthetase family protein [Candidatus Cloacimonadota bacterium]